jgi:mRNA-decapping enzyme subunit 2
MANRIASMTLQDWLDDLTVRFLLNLPPAEMSSMPRLCFQVEEAQWFYEDFVRPANPQLPSLNLRQFCLTLFRHSPLLSGFSEAQHSAAYEEFLAYKVRVPVRGAILMDESMEKVLLVRGWKKGASWSFPRGKINRDEKDLDCAIREVYEETGYDLRAAGLVSHNAQDGEVKAIDITMREQHMRLFVFRGVPLDTHFEPRTRREIGKIEWYNVRDLPGFKRHKGQAGHGLNDALTTKFYMVAPFLPHLKKWIGQQLKRGANPTMPQHGHNLSTSDYDANATTTEDEALAGNLSGAAAYAHGLAAFGPGNTTFTESRFNTVHTHQPSLHAGSDLLAMLKGNGSAATGASTWGQSVHGQIEPYSQHGEQNRQIFEADSAQLPHNPPRELHGQQSVQPGSMQFSGRQGALPQGLYDFSGASPHAGPAQQSSNQHDSYARESQMQQSFHSQSAMSSRPQGHEWTSNNFQNLPPNPQSQQSAISQPAATHPQQRTIPIGQLFAQGQTQSNTLLDLLKQPKAPQLQAGQSNNSEHQLQDTRTFDPTHARPTSNDPSSQPSAGHFPPSAQQIYDNGVPHAQPTQGQKGPLSVGPAIPDASSMPTKTLNMHAAKLLGAFKSANAGKFTDTARVTSSTKAQDSNVPSAGKQHQSALLGLFQTAKSPSVPSVASAATAPQPERSTSPALTDKTETPLPRKARDRKPAVQPKVTSSPAAKPAAESKTIPIAQQQQPAAPPRAAARKDQNKRTAPPNTNRSASAKVVELSTSAERPKSRGQLFDPSKPNKSGASSAAPAKAEAPPSVSNNDARPNSKGTPRAAGNPARPRPASNVQPTPQFSILQRPGSSAGKASVPPSPLRNESSKTGTFQPQLLKRPVGENESTTIAPVPQGKSSEAQLETSNDKRDNLLALFGKTSSPLSHPTKASPPPPPPTAEKEAMQPINQKDKLLNLFGAKSPTPSGSSFAPPPSSTKTMSPPTAPQLLSEPRSSSRQSQQTTTSTSQQLLMNLFNNTNNPAHSVLSPGTPISPFALGTPIVSRALPALGNPPSKQQQQQQPLHMSLPDLIAPPPVRSRVGSLQPSSASLSGGLISGQQTPTSATPTEAKNFLLDYLNGVVQKEGGGKPKARGVS